MTVSTDIIVMAFQAAGIPAADEDQKTEGIKWLTFMTEAWTKQGISVSFDPVVIDVELNETDGSTAALISNLAIAIILGLNLTVDRDRFSMLDVAAIKDLAMVKAAFPAA